MNWLKRNWKKILTGFVILLVLAAVYIFYPVHEDLSSLKDRAANYNVKILRDTYGVPHIYGHTDADAAYRLAYTHSEDDFLTTQAQNRQSLRRASSQGSLARFVSSQWQIYRRREKIFAVFRARFNNRLSLWRSSRT